jgi:hypothetical protein
MAVYTGGPGFGDENASHFLHATSVEPGSGFQARYAWTVPA